MQKAQSFFKDTNTKITTEGQRHLGAVIGSETFKKKICSRKNRPMDKRVRCLV